MDTSRRRFLSGTTVVAATALGVSAGNPALADGHDVSVAIVAVDAEGETVTIENRGPDEVDLSGYVLDWEHSGEKTQTDELPGDTTIEAGRTLVIASGYDGSEGDVTYDYDNGRINDEDPDVIALLTPDESEVVTTSEEVGSTPTATPTEAPEETETETPSGSETTPGPEPGFHCSYVSFEEFADVEQARVTFTDGSYVESSDGVPETLSSPGRVVSTATIDGTAFENPDTDCDPGQKATTFTCRSVTVECEEFVRDFGDAPQDDLVEGAVLYFADGTSEQRTPPLDPTDTFQGTGDSEGKKLAAFQLDHAAFRTTHVWRNPNVDA